MILFVRPSFHSQVLAVSAVDARQTLVLGRKLFGVDAKHALIEVIHQVCNFPDDGNFLDEVFIFTDPGWLQSTQNHRFNAQIKKKGRTE